jgi:hypothetical protein
VSTNVCNPEGYRAYDRLLNPAETEDLQFNSNTMFLCRRVAKQCQRRWPGLFYAIVLFSVDVSALPTTGYSSCGFHQNAYIALRASHPIGPRSSAHRLCAPSSAEAHRVRQLAGAFGPRHSAGQRPHRRPPRGCRKTQRHLPPGQPDTAGSACSGVREDPLRALGHVRFFRFLRFWAGLWFPSPSLGGLKLGKLSVFCVFCS